MARVNPMSSILSMMTKLTKKDLVQLKLRCELQLESLVSQDKPDREELAFYSIATRMLLENGDSRKYPDYSLFKRNNASLVKNLSSLLEWISIWTKENLAGKDENLNWEDRILFFRFYCKICISSIIMVEKCPLGLRPIINFGKSRFLRYLEYSFPAYINSGVWKLAAKKVCNIN